MKACKGFTRKMDAELARLSTKYGLSQNEPIRDLRSRIKKGEIDDGDINIASAIVTEVSNNSADAEPTETDKQEAYRRRKQIVDSLAAIWIFSLGLPFIIPLRVLVTNIPRNGIFQFTNFVLIVVIAFQTCIIFSLGPLQSIPNVPNLILSHPIEFLLTYVFLFPLCFTLPTIFFSNNGEYVHCGAGFAAFIGIIISGIVLLLMLAYAFLAGGNLTAFATLLSQFVAISVLNLLIPRSKNSEPDD